MAEVENKAVEQPTMEQLSASIVEKLGQFKEENANLKAEFSDKVADLTAKLSDSEAKVTELTDKIANFSNKNKFMGVPSMDIELKDNGSRFAQSEEYKTFKSNLNNKNASVRVELAATPIGTTTSNSISVNTFSSPVNAGIVTDPKAVLNIEQLFGKIAVNSSSFEYTLLNDINSSTATASGPGVVAEGEDKPETAYAGQKYLGKVETIAHWTKLTEQLVADNSNVVSLINEDMVYKVNKLIDRQLLNGTGSSQLGGLSKTGNYTDYNTLAGLATGDTLIDVVRKVRFAMNAASIDNLTLILNPMDWCAVLGTKNANKDYLIPGIVDLAGQRIYGIPVVLNSGVTQGKYFMGDFYNGAKIFERAGIAVEMDREGADFTKNLITLRVERRLGFAVMQPKAIAYGDFAVQA